MAVRPVHGTDLPGYGDESAAVLLERSVPCLHVPLWWSCGLLPPTEI